MIDKLLTEHHLEFLSLKGGCTGSSESTLVKMSNCWKSQVMPRLIWNQACLITLCVVENYVSSHLLTSYFNFLCRNIVTVSKSLDPGQARLFDGPNLGPDYQQ